MSLFSKIKDAVFGWSEPGRGDAPKVAPTSTAPKPGAVPRPGGSATQQAAPAQPQPTSVVPTSVVNVENSLDSMPGADRLNWRTSITDLMKLIGVDSDYESRKALATEMGRSDYKGDAEDNVWLHKRVMQELASNGGKVPESLR
jgi:hypothetical protein